MKLIRRRRGLNSGFSVLEVLIGMVVLAIAIGSAYELSLTTSRLVQRNQFLANATSLAEYKMEELRNTAYDQVATGTHSDTGTLDALGNAGGIYSRSWTVVADQPATDLKKITVVVSWNQLGQTRTFTLTGVIGR